MPNIIKKVLANVAQALTDTEKQQARDNIGIQKYVKLASYDTSITDIDNAGLITTVGDFQILYYHDNGGNLRLAIENMDIGDPHNIIVSSVSNIETHTSVSFGTIQALSVSFSSGNGMHQDLRFIIDGVNFGELSIQWIQSATTGASQLWYKG